MSWVEWLRSHHVLSKRAEARTPSKAALAPGKFQGKDKRQRNPYFEFFHCGSLFFPLFFFSFHSIFFLVDSSEHDFFAWFAWICRHFWWYLAVAFRKDKNYLGVHGILHMGNCRFFSPRALFLCLIQGNPSLIRETWDTSNPNPDARQRRVFQHNRRSRTEKKKKIKIKKKEKGDRGVLQKGTDRTDRGLGLCRYAG